MRQLHWLLFSGLFVVAHSIESYAAAPSRKVVIGHAAMNARVAPLWVAEDHGFFVKHGVNASAIFIRQAPVLVAALTAGDVHAAYTGGTTVLTAVAGGADLKIIATLTNKLGYDIVAAPSVKTAKDLRGKKVGVQTLAGTVWLGAMLGLEHLGLEPQRDKVTFLVVGDQTVAVQALEAGQIDMTVLDGVFSRRLKQKGFNILAELAKEKIPFSSQGLVARGSTLQEQRDMIESIEKGLLEGIAFCLSPRNKAAVIATIMKRLKLNDQSAAEEGYLDVINGVERKPLPVIEGLRNIQRLMKMRNPAIDKLKMEDLVDDRILRRLDESGFIDGLAKTYPAK
jgi:NitT/TauT family transport system substrate-binding protein